MVTVDQGSMLAPDARQGHWLAFLGGVDEAFAHQHIIEFKQISECLATDNACIGVVAEDRFANFRMRCKLRPGGATINGYVRTHDAGVERGQVGLHWIGVGEVAPLAGAGKRRLVACTVVTCGEYQVGCADFASQCQQVGDEFHRLQQHVLIRSLILDIGIRNWIIQCVIVGRVGDFSGRPVDLVRLRFAADFGIGQRESIALCVFEVLEFLLAHANTWQHTVGNQFLIAIGNGDGGQLRLDRKGCARHSVSLR